MHMLNRIGIRFCLLRMHEIFSRGHELEVEGDDSHVVVAVEYSKLFVVAGEVKRSAGDSITTS